MRKELTTPQLREAVEHILAQRSRIPSDAILLTRLLPTLVDCDGPGRSLEFAYDTQPWMTNPMGMVHGGVIATMVDNAMGMSCSCLCGHSTPTVTMNVSYARSVPLNARVHLRARVLYCGSTTAQVTAEIYLPEQPDRVLVSASGVYFTKPLPGKEK